MIQCSKHQHSWASRHNFALTVQIFIIKRPFLYCNHNIPLQHSLHMFLCTHNMKCMCVSMYVSFHFL